MTAEPLERFTPYTNVSALFSALPQWMDEYDAQRVMAYQIYEQVYWNEPDTFKLQQRGTEATPIYIPNARTIIDTTNRFIGKDWAPVLDPDAGTTGEQGELSIILTALLRRERFFSKFASNKRYGLIRGDWCWHVIGNGEKPSGKRLRIDALDPAAYFPVTHPDDPERIIGAHIVEQIKVGEEWVIKRQTYQKGRDPVNNDGSDTTIYNSIATYKPDDWQELGAKSVNVIKPPTALPPQVTAIPIYHIKNIEPPGDPYGSSELRGLVRIMGAVNQAVSDEELALALDGLGLYATDGGPPRDDNGNIMSWLLGPGRVVEHPPGSKFGRVNGVNSVTPVQDHLRYLTHSIRESAATPDAAVGKVDVNVAESGIALTMQLAPLLAKADERDDMISGTMDQFLFDLAQQWLPAYEGYSGDAIPVSTFGEKLPQNRKQTIEEIVTLVKEGVASAEWGRTELTKLGYVFPEDEGVRLMTEQQARALAIDPFAARMAAEGELTAE